MEPKPAPVSVDMPATAVACRGELERVERETSELRRQVLRDQGPRQAFARSAFDPAFTEEVARDVRGALPPGASSDEVSVECRGDVCRVEPSAQLLARHPGWQKKMERHTPFRLRVHGGDGRHYRLAPRGWALGGNYLIPLFAILSELPGITACERRFADLRGWLDTYLMIVGADRREDDPPAGTLVAFYRGPLMGSAFNDCVGEAVNAFVAAAPKAPAPISTARSFRRFAYPRTGPPKGPLDLYP